MNNLFFLRNVHVYNSISNHFNLKNLDKIKRSTSKIFIFMDSVLGLMVILIGFAN
jgi:hypothetical protein